jgi:hypothetical protein
MTWRRAEMNALGVTPAIDLARVPDGRLARIAGSVIVRYKFAVLGEPFLLIRGVLQNLDGVISVKAGRIEGLRAGATAESHDFH